MIEATKVQDPWEDLAGESDEPQPQHDAYRGNGHGYRRLLVPDWLRDCGIPFKGPKILSDGRAAYILDRCVFDQTHTGQDASVIQGTDGKTGYHCFHATCSDKDFQALKAAIGKPDPQRHYDPPYSSESRNGSSHARPQTETHVPIERLTLRQLSEQNPRLHDPIIDGLLREREVLNIISVSKVGKSWLMYGLLLSVITGRPWLGRFNTSAGHALLVDNELHKPTLAARIKTVGDAMGIPYEEYADALEIMSLRGRSKSIFEIASELQDIKPGTFKLISVDAKYRAIPRGTSENDNSDETNFYNCVDAIGEQSGAGIPLIHHSSKGGQADKRVTDVGSGAGAQSRAADSHLILREHEEAGAVVLEAAVRSFAPVEPVVLRWQFPLWQPDQDLDPALLKRAPTGNEEKQRRDNIDAEDKVLEELSKQSWQSRRQLHLATGMGPERVNKAVARLLTAKKLDRNIERRRGQDCEVFRRSIHVHDSY